VLPVLPLRVGDPIIIRSMLSLQVHGSKGAEQRMKQCVKLHSMTSE
jgi:hypothetical protein